MADTFERIKVWLPKQWVRASEATFSGNLDDVPAGATNKHLTATLKSNYDTAYSHSQTTHAPSNADNTDTNLLNNGNKLTSLEDTDRLLVVQLVEGEPQVVGWIQFGNVKRQLKDYFDTLYDPL